MKIRDYLLLQEINNQDLNSAQWLTECFLESRSTKELYSTDETADSLRVGATNQQTKNYDTE